MVRCKQIKQMATAPTYHWPLQQEAHGRETHVKQNQRKFLAQLTDQPATNQIILSNSMR